jgi:hypothetical protein
MEGVFYHHFAHQDCSLKVFEGLADGADIVLCCLRFRLLVGRHGACRLENKVSHLSRLSPPSHFLLLAYKEAGFCNMKAVGFRLGQRALVVGERDGEPHRDTATEDRQGMSGEDVVRFSPMAAFQPSSPPRRGAGAMAPNDRSALHASILPKRTSRQIADMATRTAVAPSVAAQTFRHKLGADWQKMPKDLEKWPRDVRRAEISY